MPTLNSLLLQPEFSKNFWDSFALPERQPVTCIITTYNRCPFDPYSAKGKYNPLDWSVRSLLAQRPRVHEIIIIDDGSTDYTKKTARHLKSMIQEKGILYRYLKHAKKKGTPISRNAGVRRATGDFIFFMDDDCIVSKYSIYATLRTFNEMQRRGLAVGVISLPIYNLYTAPVKAVPAKTIGNINFTKGEASLNFDCFPKEYLSVKNTADIFIDSERKLLRPLQNQFMVGVFLCSKKVYERVGGFPTYINWNNASAEEPEFGCRLLDNGYCLFMQPDPKAGVFHGRFGYKTAVKYSRRQRQHLEEEAVSGITYKQLVELCRTPRLDTGNRTSTTDWYYSKIIGLFVLFYKRNPLGALAWAKRTHVEFVLKNLRKFRPPTKIGVESKEERQSIWHAAITDGIALVSGLYTLGSVDFFKTLTQEIEKLDDALTGMELFDTQ